jgi:hypothetical protein
MSSFAALKKNSSLDKLTKALEQTNKQNKGDDRYWKPTVDKAGNGSAVIRFLDTPEVDGEDGLPWVQLFSHGFEGPGGWYIENSLTTLGLKDPVAEYNSKLWKTGVEENKKIVRKQKRRLSYTSNILVIKDPGNPDNEGKIFLYSYGKKIFDKIRVCIKPTEEEIKAAALEDITLVKVPVFDFWKGHNFRLRIRKVEGYRNYDTSSFEGLATAENPAKGTPIADSDEKIEKIWRSAYSLKALKAPDQFKSYEELEAKFHKVIGLDGSKPVNSGPVKAKPVEAEQTPPWEETPVAAGGDEDDDDKMLNMFNGLADDDE